MICLDSGGRTDQKNVNRVATRKNPSEPLFGINITPTANAADNAFEIVNHVKRYTLMFSRLGHEKRRRSKGKES
jgi:hypothetical protein